MDSTFKLFQSLSRTYSTPKKVQSFLKTLTYNREKRAETVRSASETFRLKKAHCLEAALISAAILEHKGYPPILLSLDSADNLCHAVFAFKEKSGWGAIAKSRDAGLHGREPRFRSLRDLALSYYDPFIDKSGKLIGYADINLDESETNWRSSPRNIWQLEQYIVTYKHKKIVSSKKRYEKLYKKYLETGSPVSTGKHWW